MAEAPAAIWIVFVGIGLPLIILASLALRFGLFWEAAKQAAQVSCQAQTFQANPAFPANALSASNSAYITANNTIQAVGGCSLNQVNVYIGSTPMNSLTTTWLNAGAPNQPISPSLIDTDQNVYSIKVVLVGQVNPLITFNLPYFGNIPGITQPLPASVAEERVFENPMGLSQ
jgi:hypothetical protein